MKKIAPIATLILGFNFFAPGVFAAEEDGRHRLAAISSLGLALILFLAKMASKICVQINQPPVLGELIVGIVLGSFAVCGFHGLDF